MPHHIGLHQLPAVDAGADSADQLQRRDGEGLAEGGGGQLGQVPGRAEGVPAPPDAAAFAGEVNAGGGGEVLVVVAGHVQKAEGLAVVIKAFRPHPLADVHEGHVAGMLGRLGQVLAAVAPAFPASDGAGAANDVDSAGAIKAVVQADHALLQGHGQGDDLEGGARLIGVGQGLVPPLAGLGLAQQPGALFLRFTGVDNGHVRIADRQKVVQIIAAQGGHGQDLPGVHIHGDGAGAVLNIVICHGLLQVLFHIVLDGLINGGDHVEAVLAGVIFLKLGEQQFCSHGVGGPDCPAGTAGKGFVILGFDPLKAVVIRAHKADQMAGQRGIGVIPLGIRLQADTPQAILALERANRIGLLLFQLPGHRHIPAALLPGFLVNLIIIHAQNLGKAPGDQGPVLAIHLDFLGAEIHVIHRGADRQGVPVGVVYGAAHGGAGHRAQLLLDGHALVFFMIDDLQLVQSGQQ